MHDGEADQHDDQHQPADKAGRGQIVGQHAERRGAGGDDPDDEKEPGRISMTARSEPRAAMLRIKRKPIEATVAMERRATPAATGAL